MIKKYTFAGLKKSCYNICWEKMYFYKTSTKVKLVSTLVG